MLNFLKEEWVVWLVDFMAVGLFFLLSAAYQIPLEVPVYTVILLQAGVLCVEGIRYLKRREAVNLLDCACETVFQCMTELPEASSETEKRYRDLVEKLTIQRAQENAEYRGAIRQSDRYYTKWSHQIKTPIAGLKLLLQEEEIDREAMAREVFKTEQYVETALQYQRLRLVGNDLVIRQNSIEGMVRQALKRMGILLAERQVLVELQDLEGSVITDEKWFVFVLEQLLGNAVKYTRKGKIIISLFEKSGRRYLKIQDTGMGIRKEDLPRIFEWGYTGVNGRMDKRATGIGLALCKESLELLGHGIIVESETGKGTTVCLDLTQKVLE